MFTLASVGCAVAHTLTFLLVCRVVQAIGAGLLQANSVALVVTSAPPDKTRTALGVQAGAQALGLALGPTIGGLLVSTVGWRWVFAVNAPIGVVGILAGYYLLPRTRERSTHQRFDWPSVGLLAVATTALLLGLSVFSGLPWPMWTAEALLAVSAAAALLMVVRQRRVAEPLVDPVILKAPGTLAGLTGALGGYLVLFGPLVLIPIALAARGISALEAGLVLTALPVGFAAAAMGLEKLMPSTWTNRFRARVGALICAVALTGMLVIPTGTTWLVCSLALLGVGLGNFTPANNVLVMARLPHRAAATGGGLINMARGLGTALGVALVTLAWQLGTTHRGLGGFHAAVLVLLLATAVTAATTLERAPRLLSAHG